MQNIHPAKILMTVQWVWRFSAGKSALEGCDALNWYVALT